jgi:tetratricopeptide (TPR) repeat protein
MATKTTRETSSTVRRPRNARSKLRQLWQVPVFISGLAALAGVWIARPYLHHSGALHLDRELAAAREALERAQPDTERALALAQAVLEKAKQTPERAGEAHFLVGSAYLLRAKAATGSLAADLWLEARQHLEQAAELGVPASDHVRLTYRLGKAWYHTGVDPQRVIEALSRTTDAGAEDPAEGYQLLTQAYLRLPNPDVKSALDANRKHLALSTEDDDRLAPIRLLRGELLLRLHEGAEARKVLTRIGRTALRKTYAQARYLSAQSFQEDQLWAEAAALWEEILHEQDEPPCEPGRILYYLGVCYRRMDRTREAGRWWEKALQHGGDVEQAAALRLAELRPPGSNAGSALEYYERGLRDLTTPASYHNSLLSIEDTRALVESGYRHYKEVGDFARCLRLARLYAKIGGPASSQELIGKAAEAWGQDCRKRSRQASGAEVATTLKNANTHLQEAGAAYEALAAATLAPADRAKWLWTSADCYLQGQDYSQAIDILKRYLATETSPEQLGAAWYKLAQAHEAQKDAASARAGFYKCIEYPGPFGYRARFELALSDIAEGKLDDAEASLKQNLELMRGAPDEETYEKSLRALAELLVKRRDFRMAALRLQELLERYPGNPATLQTRQQLAECYRRLAAQEDQNLHGGTYLTADAQLHYRDQRRVWMQMAAAHYTKLADDLSALRASRTLNPTEEGSLRQAGFALAECRFEAGDYQGAIRLYEDLVTRYPHRVEALTALKQITRCYWVQRDPNNAAETIKRIQTMLKDLPDSAFSGDADGQTRQEWEEWLEWASKQ